MKTSIPAGFAGGLVGIATGGSYIQNSSCTKATIQASAGSDYAAVGGIAGTCGNTDIINCYNASNVSGYAAADIVGYYVATDAYENSAYVNFKYCYYKSYLYGAGAGTATETKCAAFTSATSPFSGGWLSNATLLQNLNGYASFVSWRSWQKGSDGYPTMFY